MERVSLSAYKDNFIIKGGMLIRKIVGLDREAVNTAFAEFLLKKLWMWCHR